KNCTTALLILISLSGLPQFSHRKTAMGTPQTRCREMHQSGRVAIMFAIRSSPHAGSHFTRLISSSVSVRRVPPVICVSMGVNHAGARVHSHVVCQHPKNLPSFPR